MPRPCSKCGRVHDDDEPCFVPEPDDDDDKDLDEEE